MPNATIETEEVTERRLMRPSERPIAFQEFLELCGAKDNLELVKGVMVSKAMVQWDHERLNGWLYVVLKGYAQKRGLGVVAGSRTMVEINAFGGRMPDLLFVRKERMDIIQQKALSDAPDLVIEIRSPNDWRSDIIALETDYRSIGVAEIVFIDPQKERVRVLRRRESGDYDEETQTAGPLRFETLRGLTLQTEWLFEEPRRDEFDLLNELLAQE